MLQGKVRIGLLGLGTVGSSVVQLLHEQEREIERRVGCEVAITKILVRDLNKTRTVRLRPDEKLVTDPDDVVSAGDVDLVVELMGGIDPALKYILKALDQGKPVVTANKEVISNHGAEIFEAAERKGVDIYFEGSVGGGIPIIQPLKVCLAANRINSLMCIINGTTNYILTKMAKDGVDFNAALHEAQALGYAEADPSLDIDGYDAASKLAILASIAFESRVKPTEVYREGISNIDSRDIANARSLGYVVKLLGIARRIGGAIEARVHPALIPADHPLSAVDGVFNAIYLQGSATGDLMFYGRGAGGMPTASAVVGDIIEATKNFRRGIRDTACTCFEVLPVILMNQVVTRYYVRLITKDVPGAVARVTSVLAEHGIGVARVVQRPWAADEAEVTVLTGAAADGDLALAVQQLGRCKVVKQVGGAIRIEGEPVSAQAQQIKRRVRADAGRAKLSLRQATSN